MSYILDALRRADQERQRQAVPTVHTRQQPLSAAPESEPETGSPSWAWGLALAALALGGLALWAWWSEPARGVEPPAPTATRGAARSEAMPPVLPTEPVALAAPPQVQARAVEPAAAPPRAQRPPAEPSEPPKAARPAPRQVQVAPAPQLRIDAEPVQANAPPTPLPAQLKNEWALSVDGSIYSDRPADRLLIVGGQLLREGETLREGVVLETIQPKAAVVRHKGKRYTVAF